MAESGIEKRHFPRVAVIIPVRYRPEGAAKNARIRSDNITTLGEGGCFIQTKLTYPKETRLELIFSVEEKEAHAKALVRYAVPFNPQAGGVQFPGMGLEFQMLDPKDLQQIRDFVAREQAKQGLPPRSAFSG